MDLRLGLVRPDAAREGWLLNARIAQVDRLVFMFLIMIGGCRFRTLRFTNGRILLVVCYLKRVTCTVQFVVGTSMTGRAFAGTGNLALPTSQTCGRNTATFGLGGTVIGDEAQLFGLRFLTGWVRGRRRGVMWDECGGPVGFVEGGHG